MAHKPRCESLGAYKAPPVRLPALDFANSLKLLANAVELELRHTVSHLRVDHRIESNVASTEERHHALSVNSPPFASRPVQLNALVVVVELPADPNRFGQSRAFRKTFEDFTYSNLVLYSLVRTPRCPVL